MRYVQLFTLFCFFLVIAYVERQVSVLPLTWLLLCTIAVRSKPSLFLLIFFSLIADVVLAIPLGMSALLVSFFAFAQRHIPTSPLFSLPLSFVLGVIVGILYGLLRGTVGIELSLLTGIGSTLLYTFGSRSLEIEEVGNV